MGGIEYSITPSAPNSDYPLVSAPVGDPDPDGPDDTESRQWKTTKIGVPDPNPLNNFRVKCRYYVDQQTPQGETVRQYPGFELISQTLECVSPSGGDVFVVGTPPEYLDYPEFPTFTADLEEYPANAYAVAGITDGVGGSMVNPAAGLQQLVTTNNMIQTVLLGNRLRTVGVGNEIVTIGGIQKITAAMIFLN